MFRILGGVTRTILICLLLSITVGVSAQITRVQPPNPTSVDNIIVHVTAPLGGMVLQPIVFTGSELHITFRGFSILPSGEGHRVSLGRLAPGNYSIIVTFVFAEGEEVGDIVTYPPFPLAVHEGFFVPTMNDFALLALAMMLAFAGAMLVRR